MRIPSETLKIWLTHSHNMQVEGGFPFIQYVMDLKKELKERGDS